MTDYVMVKRSDLLRWAEDFVRDNDPGDDTDVVTPFDDYLLRPPAVAQPVENGVVQRHVVTKFSDGSTRVEDVLTAPSAPVGVVGLVRDLVREIERNTCAHEDTYRGGAIWEICDACGAEWADDRGGKPDFKWPDCVERARAWLSQQPAAVDEVAVLRGLLDEVRSHFTRDDDLPGDLLPRIDAALAAQQGGES